jgi:Rrf2 family transcriptional regulator, repressor of oqxAB
MNAQLLDCFGWFRVAVQALVLIAETDGVCSSSIIARELQSHAAFLRRVTARLVQAQILVAREGRAGGYRLARPAEQITLAQVYRAAKVAYQQEPTTGSLPSNLRVQTMLNEVADELERALLATLDRYTIAALMEETGEAATEGPPYIG